MSRTNIGLYVGLLLIICAAPVLPQQPATVVNSSNAAVVPPLVSFSGVLTDVNGKRLTSITGVTFFLYKEEQGGAPLWMETQNVQPDKTGHYVVMLGSTTSTGLPGDIFVAGEARWLGVQPQGQAEQARVMLLSVPYALKAVDAQTIGGLPASAFVLAAPPISSASPTMPTTGAQPLATGTTPVTTAGGTVNKLAKFDAAADITNSQIFDNGTNVGIGTTTPAAKLDVKGSSTVRGLFSLPQTANATATTGYTSQPLKVTASVFNSGTGTAVAQNFQLQAEPVGNNTSNTSGTLNLLYSTGTNKLAETGLRIGSNGQITFAAGQTFPGTGTGNGSVTSVGSGAGLTGGPITGSGSLSIATGAVTNAMLVNPSLTITHGTYLKGGGVVALGAATSLDLDTTKVPLLIASNTFTGNQMVNGNLSATQWVSGSGFEIGSNLFAFGSYANANAFLGFGGNATTTGKYNTASGFLALYSNTTGPSNTATGVGALFTNGSGGYNTASGADALYLNSGGSYNSATGDAALFSNSTGTNNTATGYQALYRNSGGSYNSATGVSALFSNSTASNNTADGYQALYSNTTGTSNTATGYQALYNNTSYSNNTADGYQAMYSNNTGGANTATGVNSLRANTSGNNNVADGLGALQSNTTGSQNTGVGYTALSLMTTGSYDTGLGYSAQLGSGNLTNATAIGAWSQVNQNNSLVLGCVFGVNQCPTTVSVGIATNAPTNILTIGQYWGDAIADGWDTYSSRRWKTNIETLHGALAKVEQLRGVSYDLKGSGKHEIGVIAEEVGAVVPELVSYEKNGTDAKGVDYGRLTALLIEATKEQQALIHKQQAQIARLARQVTTIQATLKASGRSGSEVRTVKAEGTTVRQ